MLCDPTSRTNDRLRRWSRSWRSRTAEFTVRGRTGLEQCRRTAGHSVRLCFLAEKEGEEGRDKGREEKEVELEAETRFCRCFFSAHLDHAGGLAYIMEKVSSVPLFLGSSSG